MITWWPTYVCKAASVSSSTSSRCQFTVSYFSVTIGEGSKRRLGAGEDAEEEAPPEPAKEAPAADEPQPPTEEEAPAAEVPPPTTENEGKAEENIPDETGDAGDAAVATQPEPSAAATPNQAPTPTPTPNQAPTPTPAPAPAEGQKTDPAPDGAEHKDDESLALASRVSSRMSTKEKSARDGSLLSNVTRLERRLSKVELHKEHASVEMEQFVSNFTTQLKIVMEQMNNVAHMLIDRKPDPQRIKVIRLFAKQMKALMGTPDREVSISWSSEEIEAGDGGDEMEGMGEDELQEESSSAPTEWGEHEQEAQTDLDLPRGHDRVHHDILGLKSQFCELTNKVNELSAALVRQDCQRLLGTMKELQDAMRELQIFMSSSRETVSTMLQRLNEAVKQIDILKKANALLDAVKSDRNEVELQLAEKVNFQQLATKVSLEQLEDYKVALEKMFCELRHVVTGNERNVLQIIDNLRMSLGIDAMELGLKDFRALIERKVQVIADALQRYMDMTNDDCAAAAGRVKVMQDLACLSCDSTCVMRTVERSKLPSLPKAKTSVSLGPIVAFELGQIRDSGVMGYYCKDEYPHAPNAWSKGTSGVSMLNCRGRHAGGVHTVHTAEEHMQKVVLSKKNTGWT